MTFKTDVDGGYKAGFLCFLLFTAIFVYFLSLIHISLGSRSWRRTLEKRRRH